MSAKFVKVGELAINLGFITSVKWERDVLFVHEAGGNWQKFTGRPAHQLWEAVMANLAADLNTGEVKE